MATKKSKDFNWNTVLRAWNASTCRRKGFFDKLTTFHQLVIPITDEYGPIPTRIDPTPLFRWWPRDNLDEMLKRYGNERSWSSLAPEIRPGLERTAHMIYTYRAQPELLAATLLAAVCRRSQADVPETWGVRAREAMQSVLSVSRARLGSFGEGWAGTTKYVLPTQDHNYPFKRIPRNRIDMVAVAVEELTYLGKHWQLVAVVFQPEAPLCAEERAAKARGKLTKEFGLAVQFAAMLGSRLATENNAGLIQQIFFQRGSESRGLQVPSGAILILAQNGNATLGRYEAPILQNPSPVFDHPANVVEMEAEALAAVLARFPEAVSHGPILFSTCPEELAARAIWKS